ncbi:glutathione S-transferase family protein [Thalassolituus sp.]|uniref:glutathione S-transferase family protein n=1 Tax=Thalassolituus sp. TaxID=2030822 RepID=UPI00351464E4
MSVFLYQFPVSHYCEKVRWVLDYKKIEYKKINLVPGPHISRVRKIAANSFVPVLEHHGDIVQGSSQILDYLEEHYPDKPLVPADEDLARRVQDWEARLDEVAGPAVRTFVYHYLLPQPRVIIPLLGAKQPWFMRLFLRVGYRRISSVMRRWMKINEASAHQAMDDMDRILGELRQIYAHNRFLVGDAFTRADLTACSLFAPLFQPSGYGLKWPSMKHAPEEMAQWLESHEGALRSLALRYEQNR